MDWRLSNDISDQTPRARYACRILELCENGNLLVTLHLYTFEKSRTLQAASYALRSGREILDLVGVRGFNKNTRIRLQTKNPSVAYSIWQGDAILTFDVVFAVFASFFAILFLFVVVVTSVYPHVQSWKCLHRRNLHCCCRRLPLKPRASSV